MPKSKPSPLHHSRRVVPPDCLDLIDEAAEACRAIRTLAHLLDMAGRAPDWEGVQTAETGWLLICHAETLRATLDKLTVILAKSKKALTRG